ncbi:hypothetical protein M9H77_17589 [Catharanthus roseus]|uniref:Uncharacterized protein n=1 Tax=Catharanthus roseus TaxID=4058 RepID=A0ACC0B524_CATRO|nr:hypothetical protein M9H77_17589 [Catharanthus roseus]
MKKLSESGSGSGRGCSKGPSSGLSSLLVQDMPGSREFPYTGAFYNFVYTCIVDGKNVAGDGKCGFRVLSYLLYDDENQWPKVRSQMWNEMHEKWDLYWNFFGGGERFYKILRGSAHWDDFVPRHCWIDIPEHLILMANTFNLCIVRIAKQDSCTIFAILLIVGPRLLHYCH